MTQAAPHSGSYFPALDTTRAIGAIAVVGTHAAFLSGAYLTHGLWGTLLARLDVGVAIFFVLSGFLLSRQWLIRRATQRPYPPIPDYFWKRFLRIYPVYLIGILPALIWVGQESPMWPARWISNITMVDIYIFPRLPHGMTQMWSLATEVAFYLSLPLIIWALAGRRGHIDKPPSGPNLPTARMVLVLAAMVAINLAWFPLTIELTAQKDAPQLWHWLPAYLDWFAVGICLAWAQLRATESVGNPPRVVRWLQQLAATPWSCLTLALILLIFVSTPIAGPIMFTMPTAGEQILKNITYALIGALVVLPGVFLRPDGSYRRLMTARGPRHLGLISYGIFCIHVPILSLVYWATPYRMFTGHGWQIFLITLLLSLLAAEVIHRLVELPSNRLRHLLTPGDDHEPESSTLSL